MCVYSAHAQSSYFRWGTAANDWLLSIGMERSFLYVYKSRVSLLRLFFKVTNFHLSDSFENIWLWFDEKSFFPFNCHHYQSDKKETQPIELQIFLPFEKLARTNTKNIAMKFSMKTYFDKSLVFHFAKDAKEIETQCSLTAIAFIKFEALQKTGKKRLQRKKKQKRKITSKLIHFSFELCHCFMPFFSFIIFYCLRRWNRARRTIGS